MQMTTLLAAPEIQRSAIDVSIEKYEKTAKQWLKEQTQNN